jgi:hypothetical protein
MRKKSGDFLKSMDQFKVSLQSISPMHLQDVLPTSVTIYSLSVQITTTTYVHAIALSHSLTYITFSTFFVFLPPFLINPVCFVAVVSVYIDNPEVARIREYHEHSCHQEHPLW